VAISGSAWVLPVISVIGWDLRASQPWTIKVE
jgi:hypothetical protein